MIDDGVFYDVKLNALTNSLEMSPKQDLGYAAIEVPTPALASLDWFTNGFMRLEEIDGRLVATDLRLKKGTRGYRFKFALAEKDTDGWKEISPFRL